MFDLSQGFYFKDQDDCLWTTAVDHPTELKLELYSRQGSLSRRLYGETLKDYSPRFQTGYEYKNNLVRSRFHDERFIEDFNRAHTLIKQKQLKKAVIYNTLEMEFERPFAPERLWRNSLEFKGPTFDFGQWSEGEGCFGLSPEILFGSQIGQKPWHYHAMALAGTSTDPDEIQTNERLSDEHSLVTQHYKEAFEQNSIEHQVSERELIPYGDFYHWRQNIAFQTQMGTGDLIDLLAPTPAIGVYPKKNLDKVWGQFSFNLHKEFDLYAGLFFLQTQAFTQAIVMIRSLFWAGRHLWIHAGCGVIAESNLEEELSESKMKINQVSQLLA
jgi:menaquinone-specific isochorismate synthase